MTRTETLQGKLEKMEILVDALLEERRGLREDLRRIENRMKKLGEETVATQGGEEFLKSLDDLRRKLAESEAVNQKLLRERGMVKDRLSQLLGRLDLIEAKLLDQRSSAGQ
jgi:hypothetical protein